MTMNPRNERGPSMRRVRFITPPSGGLFVASARAALANFHFSRRRQGQLVIRGPERAATDLKWLGIDWSETGTPGDTAGAIEHLKQIGRLYPCFETETELRARREYRIRRGQAAVYDRAMLKLTPAQRAAAEAGGKVPHWRFRLSNRAVIWMDAISGRREAKLPSVSDPVVVAADGTPSSHLIAVVDDIADGITHVIGPDEGDGTAGFHIDLLDSLGQDSSRVVFAWLPPLGETGRLTIRDLRNDGIDPEALSNWLGISARFNIRDLRSVPDPAALPAINRGVLARRSFMSVADRLPRGATEPFWLAIRGHIDLLTEARHWWEVVNGTIFPPMSHDAADFARALPAEPWNAAAIAAWLHGLPPGAIARLRLMLTGEEQGPELAVLLPLIGRARALERLGGP